MKRYKVTKENPILKEGLIISYNEDAGCYFTRDKQFTLDVDRIPIQLENKWIEEIPRPEFTKQDMIDFANQVSDLYVKETDLERFIEDKKTITLDF